MALSTPDAPRMPKLIAFDLDELALWLSAPVLSVSSLWIDTHATPPFTRKGNALNEIWDAHGTQISFYDDVPHIIAQLEGKATLALCSRTHAPPAAREALDLLFIKDVSDDDRPARQFFEHEEIYPGSKMQHFRELHRKTGIPYKDMLFFDDEYRNSEVSKLGVMFVLVDRGLGRATFDKGLAKWRARASDG